MHMYSAGVGNAEYQLILENGSCHTMPSIPTNADGLQGSVINNDYCIVQPVATRQTCNPDLCAAYMYVYIVSAPIEYNTTGQK